MYLKLPFKILTFLLIFITMLSLGACNRNNVFSATKMEFSFDTNTPSNSSKEKSIYINNELDKLTLNADLKIDSGEAVVQVVNTSNDEIIWSSDYKIDSNFNIELTDIKADSEYLLKIYTKQSQKVNLIITSDKKLVQDKEKPEKYVVDK